MKLTYLRQACAANHSSLIDHIPTAAGDNYDRARKVIMERLYNPRVIAYSLINQFLTYPQVKPDSGAAILKLTEQVNGMKADLAKLNVDTSGWDTIIMCILTDKMDDKTRREYLTRYPSKELPKLKECMDFLEDWGIALSVLNKGATDTDEAKKANNNNKGGGGGKNSILNQQLAATAQLAAAAQSLADARNQKPWQNNSGQGSSGQGNAERTRPTSQAKPACAHCDGTHWTPRCTEFQKLTPRDRHASIKEKNHCFNCLGVGHTRGQCPSKGRCRECQGQHHTMLHFTDSAPRAQQKKAEVLVDVQRKLRSALQRLSWVRRKLRVSANPEIYMWAGR